MERKKKSIIWTIIKIFILIAIIFNIINGIKNKNLQKNNKN